MLRRFAAAADVVFVYAQTEMSRSAALQWRVHALTPH